MKFHILIVSIVLSFYVSCNDDIKKNNDIQYGSFQKKNGIEFKWYAPNSSNVELIIFEKSAFLRIWLEIDFSWTRRRFGDHFGSQMGAKIEKNMTKDAL